jgi:hypothetical protein
MTTTTTTILLRVSLLLYADDRFQAGRIPPVETAVRAVGIDLHFVETMTPDDFEAAFAAKTRQGIGGLLGMSRTTTLRPNPAVFE